MPLRLIRAGAPVTIELAGTIHGSTGSQVLEWFAVVLACGLLVLVTVWRIALVRRDNRERERPAQQGKQWRQP